LFTNSCNKFYSFLFSPFCALLVLTASVLWLHQSCAHWWMITNLQKGIQDLRTSTFCFHRITKKTQDSRWQISVFSCIAWMVILQLRNLEIFLSKE
jgi:uncharacterized membrane protein